MTLKRGNRQDRLGALPPRYSFVLNPHAHARFSKCPECNAPTRIRKLPLVIHVEDSAGPRLAIVGKTCRLCVVCDLLIAHEVDLARLIATAGFADKGRPPSYLVLGTVEPRLWRRGLSGGVTLGEIRERMADFKAYLRVDFTPGGWRRAERIPAGHRRGR